MLDHDPGGAYPRSLAASWAVAFDRLADDDPTALDLLTVVAWCGPEPVPLTLLTDHPDALPERLRPVATDPLVLARCTAILHRRGMATVSPHGIQLHRVPAALLRARSQAIEARRRRAGDNGGPVARAGRTRQPAGPIRAGGRCGNRCYRMYWSRRAATTPSTTVPAEATGCSTAPRGTCSAGARSRPPWRRPNAPTRCGATSSVTITPTPSPRPTTWPMNLWWLGEYQRARALDEDTLTRRRRILGDDHPDTLTSASQLADDLFGLGNYRQARELQEETLTRRRRILGDDHPDTLFSASHLALSCGRWVTIGRPGSSDATPGPAAAESWVTTTPTPSPRPASSAWSCAR